MCEALFWKLELQSLLPTLQKLCTCRITITPIIHSDNNKVKKKKKNKIMNLFTGLKNGCMFH